MKTITIKKLGIDGWSREVFQNVETQRLYKRYQGENAFYTTDSFDGEPDCPLKKDLIIKILVTNNEYQEILKNEASLYWSKVFAITDEQKDNGELDTLKKQYWEEMEQNLNQYEIEKFNPKLKNEALNKFIEAYCSNNNITDDYTRYQGHTRADYISIEGCEPRYSTGYNQYLACDDDLTVVEYCEGDLTVLTYNNIEAYNEQLAKAEKFYNEY